MGPLKILALAGDMLASLAGLFASWLEIYVTRISGALRAP